MSRRPDYQRYVAPEGEDGPGYTEELQEWQKSQAQILREYYNRRIEIRWWALGIVVGVVVVAALIFGGLKWLGYTQDLYGRGYRAWSWNCQAAGGLPAGPYSDPTAQVCVFKNGAQLTRTIPV